MTNVVQNIWNHADATPDGLALRSADQSWTYHELRQQISAFSRRFLELRVEPGQRVLLVAPTSPEFVFAYYGILSIGAVAVTVNTLSTRPEIEYFLRDAGCTLAVAWHDSADSTLETSKDMGIASLLLTPSPGKEAGGPVALQEVAAEEPAVLLYTSGTTGKPKGAVLTHQNLRVCGQALTAALELTSDDRLGTALPLFHVFGQAAVMSSVYTVGASLSLLHPFNGPALLTMAAEHRLTALSGVPTMWNEMLHADTTLKAEDFSELRLASSGGAALPLEVANAFRDRFGAAVLDGYGLTETTGAATFSVPGARRREGSVGTALPGIDIEIHDVDGNPVAPGTVGEVAISGPVIMAGYWNRPEATAQVTRGTWFLTGDLGMLNDEGYLWIVDRKKDLIIRGGYNVYPREVEEVLYAHPAIREAAVVGVPDERLGEEIAAVVSPVAGRQIDPIDLRAWLSERLSVYKVPRIYHIVDALPKGATGKILKRNIDRDTLLVEGSRVSRPHEQSSKNS